MTAEEQKAVDNLKAFGGRLYEVGSESAIQMCSELDLITGANDALRRQVEKLEQVNTDTERDHDNIYKFWDAHKVPGHHSIFEWLEWLVAQQKDRDHWKGRFDRLADDGLVALAGHAWTPAEGYKKAPECLGADIRRLIEEHGRQLGEERIKGAGYVDKFMALLVALQDVMSMCPGDRDCTDLCLKARSNAREALAKVKERK